MPITLLGMPFPDDLLDTLGLTPRAPGRSPLGVDPVLEAEIYDMIDRARVQAPAFHASYELAIDLLNGDRAAWRRKLAAMAAAGADGLGLPLWWLEEHVRRAGGYAPTWPVSPSELAAAVEFVRAQPAAAAPPAASAPVQWIDGTTGLPVQGTPPAGWTNAPLGIYPHLAPGGAQHDPRVFYPADYFALVTLPPGWTPVPPVPPVAPPTIPPVIELPPKGKPDPIGPVGPITPGPGDPAAPSPPVFSPPPKTPAPGKLPGEVEGEVFGLPVALVVGGAAVLLLVLLKD